MYTSKALVSMAALAGTALAQTSTDPACASSAMAFNDAPTPPPALASYLAELVNPSGQVTAPGHTTALPDITLEDPEGYQDFVCGLVEELPQSLLPAFQSYGSSLLSYGRDHLSQYDAFITDCITTGEAASKLTSELHKMLTNTGGLCQTTSTAAPNGTYPTGTGALPTSTGSSGAMVPTAAAARPAAFAGAAVVGGFVGAAAML
ncbi:hypothetical protein F4808DRAFT_329217 [Astrocystis sublimbata]|nr:hypothetical protein F4808DRAFT_329217 [Astrocystis sublimbata]